jgi:purine-binding chemotaxis protein CheW
VTQFEGDAVASSDVSLPEATGSSALAEVAVFDLGTLRFALRIEDVEELTHAFAFEPLPNAPAVVSGAANFRGRVLPVFDLRRRFGLGVRQLLASDHFVVARAGERRVILHVERALELRSLPVAPIAGERDLPPAAEVLAGTARADDGVLFIYDLSRFLSQAESLELDRALSQATVEPRSDGSR